MNPIENPYAPGAGSPPPELAGRDELRDDVRVAIERTRRGLPAKSLVLVGLRGVGKTVLLERLREDAEATGVQSVAIEAPEERSLPGLLAPELRLVLLRLSRHAQAKALARRGLRALAGFANGLRVKYHDIDVVLDIDPEPGLADNGDLEHDLYALLEQIGHAARKAGTAVVLFVNEMQYVAQRELAALIMALHRCAQRRLPVILVGAGLPQLRGLLGKAKSYAERLFEFPQIGPLPDSAARVALVKPAESLGVLIEPAAVERLLHETRGYPYFLQEWGKHSWDVAAGSPISEVDVRQAGTLATAALDKSFFLVRFDRLTTGEKRYLRAMAELGPGPHRSGDIAAQLSRRVTELGPIRNQLLAKGMIYSPSHGDTAFTVPLFDQFMRRIMPSME